MKILIAGLGSIGRRHLRNLLTLGERDLLFYRTYKSTLPENEFEEFPVETNLKAALSHQPEAVIISNPTALHLDVAIPAARQGCHLFIEKPVSHSLDRIDELHEALARGRGKVLVGYHFRFHPGLRQLKTLIAEGAIGTPYSVRAHWGEFLPGWHPWEDYHQSYSAQEELGGGVILTLSHPLDYLHWVFGEIDALWALTSTGNLGIPVEDQAEIGLRFRSGVIGSLHLDYLQQPPSHWLECIGSHGTIRWNNRDGKVQVYHCEVDGWQEYCPPNNFERNDLFLAEMKHFLKVCGDKESPLCTLEDGIVSLTLAVAALASQKQGKLIQINNCYNSALPSG